MTGVHTVAKRQGRRSAAVLSVPARPATLTGRAPGTMAPWTGLPPVAGHTALVAAGAVLERRDA